MNTMTVTSPQLAGQPMINGNNVLTTNYPLSSAATTHTAWDISSTNLVSFQALKFGTITGDCSLMLQVSLDGGANFRDFKAYTNAQLASAQGAVFTEQIKATHARFVLTLGTMTGANGFNVRALI